MSQTWSVTINPGAKNASFDPDTYGATPGGPLKAQTGDLVCWNNQTTEPHWPWPADKDFKPVTGTNGLCDAIASNESSSPAYNVPGAAGSIVYYVCFYHHAEHGTIEVVV
jgi:hypothetical protein